MSDRIPVFVNRRAKVLASTLGVEALERAAREVGVETEVLVTESSESMAAAIAEFVAKGTERIAVAGGDGTVSQAVQVLAHTDTALGIVPMGAFNNFATSLRLPMDLPSSLRALREGTVQRVDLGKVGDTYFTEAAGVGLFADALAIYGYGTNKNFMRGTYAMLRVLLAMKPHRLRLTLDGEKIVERAVLCTVANSFRMSSALAVAPGARLTDGLLNVVIVGDIGRAELLRYYLAVRGQVHANLPKVTLHEARTVNIHSKRKLNVHADDRVVTKAPATVEVQPRALNAIVDRL